MHIQMIRNKFMAIKIGWGWKQLKGSLNWHKYLSSKNSWASWKCYNDMSNLKQQKNCKKTYIRYSVSDTAVFQFQTSKFWQSMEGLLYQFVNYSSFIMK